MGNSKPTQAQRVLDYIEQFGSITQYEALKDLGIMRLASRVSELKKNGHNNDHGQEPLWRKLPCEAVHNGKWCGWLM